MTMAANICPTPLVIATSTSTATFSDQSELKSIATDSHPVGSLKMCKTLKELEQLHCRIIKQGLSRRLSTVTQLLAKCVEMGPLEALNYARKVFDLFEEDNETTGTLFMYNSLIRGYSCAGICNEAILLFVQMMGLGIMPDKFTFPFVLSACAKSAAYSEGIQIHGSTISFGLDGDVFIQNSLIHFYAECGEICSARKMFDEMLDRNVVSWTSLICGYARKDCPKEAIDLFFKMVNDGVKPNSVTMVCVISACAKLLDLELGERVSAYVGEAGLKVNTLMVNALVDMYMKCGANDIAKRLFDECLDRNLVLYNTILSNYVRQGLSREALAILGEMLQQNMQPDRITMLSAISVCSQLRNILQGKCCHGYVLRNGLQGWDSICNSIIDMYMKCGKQDMACKFFDRMSNKTVVSWNSLIAGFIGNGDVDSAMKIFNEMPETDLVSWNTIIGAFVQESMFEEAIEVFRVMQREGIRRDRVTMVGVACACGYLGALDLAKWTYCYITKNGIECDTRLATALVDMFARCGDPQSAMQIFRGMEKQDVSAWTAAIGAMAMYGNGSRAIKLFNTMLEQGGKPDGVVFVALLTACSHGGLVDQGWHLFRSMKDIHGLSVQIVHYGCMVDLLGRSGQLREALDLIQSMPMEPNDVIWGALLAACRVYKNVDLAAFAAARITELAPQKTGTRVLLSNIYASAGRWSDVAKVRLHLKENGLQKVPGSSAIEINGTIHEFTSGDESYPQRGRIGLMLDEMNCRLKDSGHIPNISNVLLDVDEHEKKFLLSRHSEKLALAFGLISTAQGSPIRIVKNLRICSDCHSYAKCVSLIYDREIILRDNSRFHLFQHGFCSCGDYW